jgi:hypothetical protein
LSPKGGRHRVGHGFDGEVLGDDPCERLILEPRRVGHGCSLEPQQRERSEAEDGERHQHLDQGEALFPLSA